MDDQTADPLADVTVWAAFVAVIVAVLVLSGCAGVRPYIQVQGESSCSGGCEVQTRFEGGAAQHKPPGVLDLFLYHESDPRNGFKGDGWPRETENGGGVRWRYYFDEQGGYWPEGS